MAKHKKGAKRKATEEVDAAQRGRDQQSDKEGGRKKKNRLASMNLSTDIEEEEGHGRPASSKSSKRKEKPFSKGKPLPPDSEDDEEVDESEDDTGKSEDLDDEEDGDESSLEGGEFEDEEINAEVTPDGAMQRKRNDMPKDDDSFDDKSVLSQAEWLNEIMAVSPASKLPTNFHNNSHSFMRGIRCILQRNEELEKRVAEYKANWEMLQLSKKAKKGRNLSVAQQQIVLEAKGAIINKVCRMVKFPKTGWELYSNSPNSVFDSLIRASVSFPTGMSEVQIELLWNDVIAPGLNRSLTNAKNRILQDVKKRFLCK
jgi:hypothetical protein